MTKTITLKTADLQLDISVENGLTLRHRDTSWHAPTLAVLHYYDRQHPRAQTVAVPTSDSTTFGTPGTLSLSATGSVSMERLDDFYVFVSNTPFASDTIAGTLAQDGVWGRHVTSIPDPSADVSVAAVGRYVRIQLVDTNLLTLAEVKVFGKALLSA